MRNLIETGGTSVPGGKAVRNFAIARSKSWSGPAPLSAATTFAMPDASGMGAAVVGAGCGSRAARTERQAVTHP